MARHAQPGPPESTFAAKQRLAQPSRYYGNGGTVHASGHLDVEVCDGQVVSVWFRCQQLPFRQLDVGEDRAQNMVTSRGRLPELTGVEVLDV